jgi:hypothetical protein
VSIIAPILWAGLAGIRRRGYRGYPAAMATTAPTNADARAYLASVTNPRRRRDALALLDLMADVTGEPAVMWGGSMVGFGSYSYRYASGRAGDWFVVGFAPRAAALTVYGIHHDDAYGVAADLARLGPHTTGKGCVYIKDLSLVDQAELTRLVRDAWAARATVGQSHSDQVLTKPE